MSKNTIYLDNASTTCIAPEVIEEVHQYWKKKLGNAGAIHQAGVLAAKDLELSRARVAQALGAQAEEIIFTSGGTEANNLAVLGFLKGLRKSTCRFACSAIEHSSILSIQEPLRQLSGEFEIIGVDENGLLQCEDLERILVKGVDLVSVMQANNETGTIQNLKRVVELCHRYNAKVHVDACQAFTKLPLNAQDLGVDLISICAHKIHGPQGIGALFVRSGLKVEPLLYGGGQERGIRPGTQNVEGAVGFAKAIDVADRMRDLWPRVEALRDRCAAGCEALGFSVTAKMANRLPNILNVHKAGFPAKKAMFELSKANIFVSLASACHANKNSPSHVLLALKLDLASISGAMRISLSRYTTEDEIDSFLAALERFDNSLR